MENLKTTDGTAWTINKGVATDPTVDGDMWCDHCFVTLINEGEQVLGGQRYSKRVCPNEDHFKLIHLGAE